MDFALSEEHRLIQTTVREFAAKEIIPIAADLDHHPRFPAELIARAASLGLLGLTVPEEYGGAGLDGLANVIVQEELARASAGVQAIVTVQNSLVCDPILRFGTPEQRRRYLPRLASGEWLGCYCLTEPEAGSDAMALQTRAEWWDGRWLLNGRKLFVTNGLEAQLAIVYARSEPVPGARGISAFLVEKSFPGISVGRVEQKLGIK
ncbi:MAG: acyl-CoA dehydrogenase family protein, partial [Armatimonadota bacterium]|nr:acyl-CoA dehydrogenase family protein [Armatimonadota bacterium]